MKRWYYKDDKRTGNGIFIFMNGNKYEGMFLNGNFMMVFQRTQMEINM